MSEYGTHVAIARARAGLAGPPEPARPPTDDAARVHAALVAVRDPEIPTVSIVDLGMVRQVLITSAEIRVTLLPTYVGCPALDAIRGAIVQALAADGRTVVVETSFAIPWTTERITPAGRAGLAAAGIAPPTAADEVACPYCASLEVVMDSAFGPTQCRSLWYCRACRQPFEALKPV